jgi:DNA-binding CsgD family transcriptional regulator/tetratricopeptide (TPR) repeat protein
MGKTALTRAVIAKAAAHGATILIGHCYDLSVTPPYGPWRELFARLPSDEGLPPLPTALAVDSDADPAGEADLFRRVHDILGAITAIRPLVVVMEDLHWADPASLDLLRYLVRQLDRLPHLLIVTYRSDEITRRHPLASLLPLLVREATTERIDLHPLDETALRTLIADRYPLPVDAETRLVGYVQRSAEGNPFYVQEMLRSLEEARLLTPGKPQWELGNLEHARVPTLLQQVIEGRLARLGDTVRTQLGVAAVIGQRVPLDIWQRVGGLSEEELLETIERAVDAQLLDAGDDGASVEFAHALVREVLYEGILPPRRRVWHRRVAEVIVDMPAPDPDAVAYHFTQAGDARAIDWLVRAGDRAFRTYAWLTARDRFVAAVALLEGDAARSNERGWLLYRLGRLMRLGDPAQGVAYLAEAERVAHVVGDQLLAAYALVDRGLLLCTLTEIEQGLAALEAGVAALEAQPADHALPDPEFRLWIADALPALAGATAAAGTTLATEPMAARRATLALWLGMTGHYVEARAMAEAYLSQAEGIERPDALVLSGVADAEFAVAHAEAGLGHPESAQAAFRRAQAIYRTIDHHFLFAISLGRHLAEVLYYTTDLVARRVLFTEATMAWERVGESGAVPDAGPLELNCLVIEGAWTEAERRARAVLTTAHLLRRMQAMIGLAMLARWRGEWAEAWVNITMALPRGVATPPGSHMFEPTSAVQQLAADLALDAGDLTVAAAWLAAHDSWLTWSGAVRGRADGRRLWARYHQVAGDHDRAGEVAAEAVTLATEPHQPLALLAAHRLLGEIATETGQWGRAQSHLHESLRLADACAAPFERALTLIALAELRAVEDKRAEAIRLLTETRAIGQPLGAAPLLARVDALAAQLAARPVPIAAGPRLSTREVEVLRLVAAGRSNPEIAEALFISPRTVTTHLTHIFDKLDVEGRAEAVALAVRGGLI